MNSEDFLDALKEQYADEINGAYLACESTDNNTVDFEKLNADLYRLCKCAKAEGLDYEDFMDLVRAEIPRSSQDKIILTEDGNQAAA